MELRKNTMLPYPVFGIEGDYKCDLPSCYLAINPDSDDEKHMVTITIEFVYKGIKNILKRIEDGNAVFSFEIDCKHTLHKHSQRVDITNQDFTNGILKWDITLEKVYYANEVTITPFITAINNFTLQGDSCVNEVYGNNPEFTIQKGDVLAVFNKIPINVAMNWKHIYKNAGAPIKVVENEGKDAVIETYLSDEITIKLPKKEYKKFREMESNSTTAPIILMTLARPAIMTALLYLRNNPGENKAWAMALKHRISTDSTLKTFGPDDGNWDSASLGWDDTDIEKIASLIFKGAEDVMFKRLIEFANSVNED